jgi:Family of unknown function (DUF6088)
MQTVEQQVLSRIYGRGRGWSFTKTDFVADFGEMNLHKALASLCARGTIRRVCHGVYDYPAHNAVLGMTLAPDVDRVAQALARKFNWRIQATGDAALNLLGLSTQVPGRWVYVSDGPAREYCIGDMGELTDTTKAQTLVLRHSALKDAGFKLRESALLVQAFKALGAARVDDAVIAQLRRQLSPAKRQHVLQDTRAVTGWVYAHIKQVCHADAATNDREAAGSEKAHP